jgi:hypothetical protein
VLDPDLVPVRVVLVEVLEDASEACAKAAWAKMSAEMTPEAFMIAIERKVVAQSGVAGWAGRTQKCRE